MSFKMISILSIWSDFHVDDRLESEVVRVILEKVVEIREQSIKKATQELIKQLEGPTKFKLNKAFHGNPRAKMHAYNNQRLKPLDIKRRTEQSFESLDISQL